MWVPSNIYSHPLAWPFEVFKLWLTPPLKALTSHGSCTYRTIVRQECKLYSCTKERQGFPWWLSGKEFACQCRRYGFNPSSNKIPHAEQQLSLWATTTETRLKSLGATATEAPTPESLCSQQEKPRQREVQAQQLGSSPHTPQPEKARAQQWRPTTTKSK